MKIINSMTGSLLPIFMVMLSFSCNSGSKSDSTLVGFEQFVDTAFKKTSNNEEAIKAYLVIPHTGCTGCISEAEHILKDFVTRKLPVRFVLTNIISFKELRLKLGDSIARNSNIYPDFNNIVYSKMREIKNIYPAIFYVGTNGDLARLEYMEPDNPQALKHLYDFLKVKYN